MSIGMRRCPVIFSTISTRSSVEHAELDGRAGRLVEVLQERQHGLAQRMPHGDQPGEREQPVADAVAAAGLVQPAQRHHLGRHPVRRRAGQARPPDHGGQRELAVFVVERVQQRGGTGQHALAVLVPGRGHVETLSPAPRVAPSARRRRRTRRRCGATWRAVVARASRRSSSSTESHGPISVELSVVRTRTTSTAASSPRTQRDQLRAKRRAGGFTLANIITDS